MFEIILTCWYQEDPTNTTEEIHPIKFDNLEETCKFLGDNCEKILDYYPAESICIKYNKNS
jgi:hypothetical protein